MIFGDIMKVGEIWKSKYFNESVKIIDIKYELFNEKHGTDYVIYYRSFADKCGRACQPRKIFLKMYEKVKNEY